MYDVRSALMTGEIKEVKKMGDNHFQGQGIYHSGRRTRNGKGRQGCVLHKRRSKGGCQRND